MSSWGLGLAKASRHAENNKIISFAFQCYIFNDHPTKRVHKTSLNLSYTHQDNKVSTGRATGSTLGGFRTFRGLGIRRVSGFRRV